MRLTLSLGLCLILLAPMAAMAHYTHGVGDAFALVKAGDEDGPTLQDDGLYIVAELPDGYLAFIDDHELDHLVSRGVEVKVLTSRDDKSLDYMVSFKHETVLAHPHQELPYTAVELHDSEHYKIYSLPVGEMEIEHHCIAEYQLVTREPLSFPRTPWIDDRDGSREVEVDASIAAALADISQAPLQTQVQHLQDYGTRHSEYNGGYLASLWIRDTFLSYGYTDVTLHDYNSWNDNVVCVKPGTVFPDEVVVMGAHYDTISYDGNNNAPGADDNGSGSVAVLEAARVLADIDFERTIIFICFSGEEEGLVGADAWAEDAADAGMNIIGMLNLDMICYKATSDTEDLDIIDNASSEPMSALAFDVIDAYVPELAAVEGYLTGGSSDHAAFWSHGFRAIFFFEDSGNYSPYLHTANDVVGTSANNFPFMLKNVRAATAFMGVFARPFHVAIAHEPQGNSESNGPFPLTAEIVSAEPLDVSSLELNYRINGGSFNSLTLAATGQPDEFGATIPTVTPGAQVEYYLSAADQLGYTVTSPDDAPADLHSFRTGVSFVFMEDGEVDQGWQLGAPGDDATTGVWIRADPVGTSYQPEDDHSHPGTLCFVTGNANPGDTAGANDVDGGKTTLVSPIFDLGDATWAGLSYWRWYTDETNHDDDFLVEISNNGGTNWQTLELVDDSAYPWVKAEFNDLGSIITLTSQMQLRFIAEDTGSGSLVEALIDDLEVVAIGDITGAEETPVFAASLKVHPNPFNPKTNFNFSLPHSGRVELRIFDATGAEVARPLAEEMDQGTHQWEFDASNLTSGIYLAQLVLDGRPLTTTKVTLLK